MSQYRQLQLEKKLQQKNRSGVREWKRAFVFAPDTLDETIETKSPQKLKIFETNMCVKVRE